MRWQANLRLVNINQDKMYFTYTQVLINRARSKKALTTKNTLLNWLANVNGAKVQRIDSNSTYSSIHRERTTANRIRIKIKWKRKITQPTTKESSFSCITCNCSKWCVTNTNSLRIKLSETKNVTTRIATINTQRRKK